MSVIFSSDFFSNVFGSPDVAARTGYCGHGVHFIHSCVWHVALEPTHVNVGLPKSSQGTEGASIRKP